MRTTRTQRIISRIRQLWEELDYAQRRALEIRTGISFGRTEKRA